MDNVGKLLYGDNSWIPGNDDELGLKHFYQCLGVAARRDAGEDCSLFGKTREEIAAIHDEGKRYWKGLGRGE